MKQITIHILLILLFSKFSLSQNNTSLQFNFNGSIQNQYAKFAGANYSFTKGIEGECLTISEKQKSTPLKLNSAIANGANDFTIQFWIKTNSNKPMVLLSQKKFTDKSIQSQQHEGWVIYTSGGTFAWSVGSGKRRLNYEIEATNKMPLCDNKWHQITMTYNKKLAEIRLYYDGHNKAIYKVGFNFINDNALTIGTINNNFNYNKNLQPQIKKGAKQLQNFVDYYNTLHRKNLQNNELLPLIIDTEAFLKTATPKADSITSQQFKNLKNIRNKMWYNPYTVFQNKNLTMLKPISKIYYLDNGKIKINQKIAQQFTQQTALYPSNFNIDNLLVTSKLLNANTILKSYNKYRKSVSFQLKKQLKTLNVADWNIWHGGKHFTLKNNNWDSRMRIVEMIKKNNVDVVLMQETYSSGDFIAAELGYYFATTTDWDYCFQGSNISIISRYPIEELYVPKEAEFMNVAAKLTLSKTQKIYAMSNWYGMSSFATVYNFHLDRFNQADKIPTIFAGDFNEVPPTDGGDNIASKKLLANGFIDAYRNLHPDVKKYPGYSHSDGVRIDQLYYKGKNLKNISTEIISKWNGGFPSDHFMILAKFKLR